MFSVIEYFLSFVGGVGFLGRFDLRERDGFVVNRGSWDMGIMC